jgi:LPXTG-motif cell wall-anchored protein
MVRTRFLAIFLVAGLIAGVAGPAALAQNGGGAGDQQYQDPFGGSTKTTTSKTKTTPSKTSGKGNGLSSTPNLGSSGSSGTSAAPATSTTAAGSGASELPRTGEDVAVVALIGLVLLLVGFGLRLRAADDRR